MRLAGTLLLFVALAAPVARAQVTLRVMTYDTEEQFALERRVMDAFTAKHPAVRIAFESAPAGYRDKLLVSFAAGTAPDVFLLDSPMVPVLVDRGLLVDLQPHAAGLGVSLDAFFPGVLAVFRRGEAVYAFPKDFSPLVMYYNRRLFDAAGVPYPAPGWTWADYLETARRLTRDTDGDGTTDQYGTAFDNKLYLWQPWVWMAGGDVLTADGTRAAGAFDSPQTAAALRFLIELRTRHGVAPPDVMVGGESRANVQGTAGLFYGGRLATMPSGRWALIQMSKYVREGALDVGVVGLPAPEGGRRATVLYAAGWCVSRTTAERAWALRLAAFLSGEEAARIRAADPIGVPALVAQAARQVAADTLGIEAVFAEEAAYGRQSWGTRVEAFARVEDLAEQAVDEVLVGGRDLPAALADGARALDAMLAGEAALAGETASLAGNPEVLRFLFGGCVVVLLLGAGSVVAAGRAGRRALLTGYAFVAPSFAVLLVFVVVPLAFSLYLGFHRWNLVSADKPFVGLANFRAVLGDPLFWNAIRNTALYTLNVPVGMVLALGIAVLLRRGVRGLAFWRALFFLPTISSFVAVAMVWQWIYHPSFGLANYALRLVGLSPQGWLTEPQTALLSVMLVSIWLHVGYQMVIFLAGLQAIPPEYYEAARVDGAGRWQQLRHVTLPLLLPTTFFVLVTSVIGSFQVFTLVYVMTEGGPLHRTDVVVYHIYRNAYDYLQMGYASAMAWLLFVVVLAVTWLQFRYVGRRIAYG